jgi:hypothetical protein
MSARIAAALLALGTLAMASPSTADVAPGTAPIHFALAACPALVGKHVASADVSYSFAPVAGAATVSGTAKWTSAADSRLQLDVALPAGFYRYAIAVKSAGGTAVVCGYELYLAALPGKERTITDTMLDGVADPITPVLLAGTLPAGMTAWLVRYDGAPACGSSTTALVRHQLLDSEVESGAYYGYDTKLTAARDNRSGVFGLELGWPNDQRRVIRLTADYPKAIVSGVPGDVRFDVTPSVEKLALGQPANTLVCARSSASS